MTNFAFLRPEWPELFESATKAEALVYPDARGACFYSRRALELAVAWLYTHDGTLKLPYQDNLSALIYEPTFKNIVGAAIHAKARVIKDLGNLAVHTTKPVRPFDALASLRELFHVCFWLARNYARTIKPPDGLAFDANQLPKSSPVPPQTLAQLQQLSAQLAEKDAKVEQLITDRLALDVELERLRAEIAEVKRKNAATPDQHNYSEAETRDYFIDLLLKEAGWALDKPQDQEFRVTGMPNTRDEGFVDYVLWGDNGKPLGLVEAKRTKRDARVGQQQAKLYADCLEKQFAQRPVIFYSNGYEHWIWDDHNYPPRQVQGFYKKPELELLVQRRETRLALAKAEIDTKIVERFYQSRAIRRIGEAFEKDHDRKALIVMATGAGKTRTVVALCDLLIRCNWVKRVLFLADRVALVKQAVNAFKGHLPTSSPVNLVTEKEVEGRVYVSTYPTMMHLIDDTIDGQRRFGVGHFDLVVIDEAHRSVYQKYRTIFEYFDSFLVGLTATPKDEVDRNTYNLFELETGVPTDVYGLDEAVKDGFLVPAKSVSVPLKFQREGIRYDHLSDEEKEDWDALEWNEEGEIPDRVEAAAINKWLFNKDTVDKVLEHLMTRGATVANGDRLGKTIVFAKNHDHAVFIADRFNANYPQFKGAFARVIDFQVEYAQSLIDDFSIPAKAPHIAISVDMLDTGIDIPEILNLVFFKLVRSKTKFWQMVGRGTRLRPDLFGPGRDKQFFYIFDYCQNLEFFSQNPETTDGAVGESLGKRLFKARVELIAALDKDVNADNKEEEKVELRQDTAEFLRSQVAAMNINNFIVRPKRKLVERYSEAKAWEKLGMEQQIELANDVASLPTEFTDDDQEAKQFDLLMLRLQLAVLQHEPSFERLRKQVIEIGYLLEEASTIPMIQHQLELIQEIQSEEFWQDVTTPMLENVRKELRSLIKLIEKGKRITVYTDFRDTLGDEETHELPGFGAGADFERFRVKARHFLQTHNSHGAIHRLRFNEPLTQADIDDLERMLVEAGAGTPDDLSRAKQESYRLGLFFRSLVGLDRGAAKEAFAGFLMGKNLTANQIEFVNLTVDHLTQRGWMEPSLLYESPFTDFSPRGVEGVFGSEEVTQLLSILTSIRQHAAV
ncbi:MAG TPA: DEAD/DEAH box helicase family protein [Candidatus Dormibacteraeota bacterium]|nr:DEAD/DEAH box helicase family protein [Candidatus Dormibacteraeota bacterium]